MPKPRKCAARLRKLRPAWRKAMKADPLVRQLVLDLDAVQTDLALRTGQLLQVVGLLASVELPQRLRKQARRLRQITAEYMNQTQAAAFLHVTPRTLRDWTYQGLIPFHRVKSDKRDKRGLIRFSRSELHQWVKAGGSGKLRRKKRRPIPPPKKKGAGNG